MNDGLPHVSGPPTLEDVARAAGVSRATVSRVINGIRNVDPAIQERVRQAIALTGYAPNQAARSLVTRRTGAIALIVSGAGSGEENPFPGQVFADPFFGRVAGGVVGHLRPLGVHPILMFADTLESRDQVIGYLRQGNADGAILVSISAEDTLPKLLADASLPAVLFARPVRPIPISYVDVAHRAGGKLAADHLVARGCRRLATISGPLDLPAAQDRLAGFQEAMAVHGHPYIPHAEGNFTFASGEAAMERLLAEHPDLDGVFAANDVMAQGAMVVLGQHGRRVPGDVAVVGFDDSSAALACRPPLTTVRHPVEDMAAEMARLLMVHIEQPDHPVTSKIFEPTLVVRESA
ncbi:LacI family DNA-binding transcriptional regulator [Planomonospora sp. ID67723]|uniref:LacI family DNA-binding transcriptional regulator n=1 Tax=Planomonospora sp. ID67723 TaxID=2738134 RepID=UPI0018C40DE6|nr:LacI family DNA-binding transcriptional regulator [Planomonospora sp. ID67723]MBG0826674.1 LacI family DNA-binding transcriptional regulator [Planomonospora sp. ID67723]